ncbi:DNA-directed DNA polymerase, partial [Coemansia sp. RSA 2703]
SYLREVAYVTLAAMVPALGQFAFRDELITMFVAVALDEGAIETPDELLLAMRLRAAYPSYDWSSALPQWQGRHMLAARNGKRLAAILCETSSDKPALFSSWHPQLHSVWDEVFSVYFGAGAGKETSAGAMEFSTLWERVADGGLFAGNASQFRRYWGYLLLERALEHVGEDAIATLITPNVVRALTEQVASASGGSGKSPLSKVGQRAAERLVAACEGNTKVGLAVLTQLLGQQKLAGQAAGSAPPTLRALLTGRIVATLDSEAIFRYVCDLQQMFLEPGTTVQGARAVDKQRAWAVDQMVRVARAAQLPVTDALTTDVLRFVAVHASLQRTTTVGGGACGVAALDGTMPTPALSQTTRDHCSSTLVAFVGDLSRISTHGRNEGQSDDAAGSGRLAIGCSREGLVWSTLALQTVAEGAKRKKVSMVLPGNDEVQVLLEQTLPVLRRMAKRTREHAEAGQTEAAQRVRALELLLGTVSVLAVFSTEPATRAEYAEVVPELCECFARLDSGEEVAEDEPQPVEVLTEILISFLTKDSLMLRKLCEQVFAPFTTLVTAAALDSIIG